MPARLPAYRLRQASQAGGRDDYPAGYRKNIPARKRLAGGEEIFPMSYVAGLIK